MRSLHASPEISKANHHGVCMKFWVFFYICYLFENSNLKAQSIWIIDHMEHLEISHFHLVGYN